MTPSEPDRRAELEGEIRQLGAILEDSVNEIYIFDADSLRFKQVNRGARENLGYSMDELRKLTPLDLKPEFSAGQLAALLEQLRSGERSRIEFSTHHRRKDASLYPVEVHLHYSDVDGDPVFVAIIVDLSERQAQQRAVAESEARAQTILETAADAILTIGESGTIEDVNQATLRLFGYEIDDLVGQNVSVLMRAPQAEEHDAYLDRYLRTGEARIIGVGREVEARRKDGTVFPARLSVGEARVGSRRLFTGIVQDLSDTRSLQEQLLQAQKMEAIGTLAGGIAHDFNNLLTSIRGSSEIIAEHVPADGRLARAAERIQRAVDRATALTTRLLGFSRQQVTQRGPVDLCAAVEETRELFVRTLPEDIELSTRHASDALHVRADEGQVGQVLMNLLVNAADAMPSGGSLAISTGRETLTGSRAETLDLAPGGYAVVHVRDTGEGIAPETRARIFDPFFTTKEVGKGTGLGLSTALGIIREHGGTIQVESELGRGTTFTVLLPAIEAPKLEKPSDGGPVARARAAGETLLLVEDDDIMRDLLCEVLEEEGYSVIPAAAPDEALAQAGAPDMRIDLLITDVVMPQMSGFLLVKELRARYPQLRVLYMSGYTDQVLADRGELTDEDPFIRKPFGNDALLEKIREVLDS